MILGSGAAVKGKGICDNVEVRVGEWNVVDSFLPLEIGELMYYWVCSGCTHWE